MGRFSARKAVRGAKKAVRGAKRTISRVAGKRTGRGSGAASGGGAKVRGFGRQQRTSESRGF